MGAAGGVGEVRHTLLQAVHPGVDGVDAGRHAVDGEGSGRGDGGAGRRGRAAVHRQVDRPGLRAVVTRHAGDRVAHGCVEVVVVDVGAVHRHRQRSGRQDGGRRSGDRRCN